MYPNNFYNPHPPGNPPPHHPQVPTPTPAISTHDTPTRRVHPMYPQGYGSMDPSLYPPGYTSMAPPIAPPIYSAPTVMAPPVYSPPTVMPTPPYALMGRLPPNIPPGYLAPTLLSSTPRHQTLTTAGTIMTQTRFAYEGTLSEEQADWPCKSMGYKFLFKSLVDLAGLTQDVVNHYTRWIATDIRWFMENNLDFGMAYACIRFAWKPLSLNYPIDLAQFRSMSWTEYSGALSFRTWVLYRDPETGQDLIRDPYGLKPARIWDLKSNRIVDYILLLVNSWVYALSQGVNMSPVPLDVYPPFWAVTHSWTKESDAVIYNTSVNSHQWPVRFPAGVTIQDVRTELLSFHGEGSDYIWLDVLCLRQEAGPEYASIKAREWKLDVPTIGNVYRLATCLVRYLNGLGRTMSTEGWDDERHWLRRAWTLQEIRQAEITHTGGVPPDVVNPMNVIGKVGGQEITLRNALAPVLELGRYVASPEGCSVYSLAREMGRRFSTNEVDKVAGLHYLLRTRRLPAYSASVAAEEAWVRCFNELGYRPRLEILLDFPYRSKSGTRWFPGWSELVDWPKRKPELNHQPPLWNAPLPFYFLLHSSDGDSTQLYIPQAAVVSHVALEATGGRPGEYRVKVRGTTRVLGFFSPYINQDPIPDGQYTFATLNICGESNWVVCRSAGHKSLQAFWGPGGPQGITVVRAMKLVKVGVLRTDAVSDMRSENVLTRSPCLFV